MYVYGFDLFFDFRAIRCLLLAASNLMGIKSPINFDRPFKSRDLKEFLESLAYEFVFLVPWFCLYASRDGIDAQ